jgi:hypothetical protein
VPRPLLILIVLVLVPLNLGYWAFVVTRGERHFRAWVMQRFDVVITTGSRGTWRESGTGSKLRLIGIEMLQLAYFMAGFLVWSVLVLISVGMLGLIERWGS